MNRATRRVASPHVVSIEDFRPLAQRKSPRVVFDYLDGGAEGEVTLRENCRAFQEVTFRPRHAVVVPHCDLSTRVLGFDFALPAQLAPVGYSRLMDPAAKSRLLGPPELLGLPTFCPPSPGIGWRMSGQPPQAMCSTSFICWVAAERQKRRLNVHGSRVFLPSLSRSIPRLPECASVTSEMA